MMADHYEEIQQQLDTLTNTGGVVSLEPRNYEIRSLPIRVPGMVTLQGTFHSSPDFQFPSQGTTFVVIADPCKSFAEVDSQDPVVLLDGHCASLRGIRIFFVGQDYADPKPFRWA